MGFLLLLTLSGCPQGSPPSSGSGDAPATTTSPAAASPATPVVASPDALLASATPAEEAFLIVPGERFGPVVPESTQASLEEAFGKDQVKAGHLPGPEGTRLPGFAVFEGDPAKHFLVFTSESEPTKIMHLQINGESSQWKTAQGVTLGTGLAELERLNGRPFELSGFGWDYGGSVTDWKGGALEGLNLQLSASTENLSEQESHAVLGDQIISSDLPELQKVDPKVTQITIFFARE
jgi:hypothetical protein